MKKTVQINIGGSVFYMDEDAFTHLEKYLNAIRMYLASEPNSKDIITDIEYRIAELLNERRNDFTQAISMHHIEEVIEIMGEPEIYNSGEQAESEAYQTNFKSDSDSATYDYNKKYYRDPDDKYIGGVASGLAHYLGISPSIMRIIFVLLVTAGGVSLIFYFILWAIIPEARTTSEKLRMKGEEINLNSMTNKMKEDYNKYKQQFDEMKEGQTAQKFKQQSANFFDSLANVLTATLRVIAFSIGLIFFLATLVIAVIFSGYIFTDFFQEPNSVFFFERYMIPGILWKLAAAVIVFVPIYYAFVLSIKLMKPSVKMGSKITNLSVLATWLLAIIVLIAGHYNRKNAAPVTDTSTYEFKLDDIDVLYIHFVDNYKSATNSKSINTRFKSHSDSTKVNVEVDKRVQYLNSRMAKKALNSLEYEVKIDSKHLDLNTHINSDKNIAFQDLDIEMEIYLPENKWLIADETAVRLLKNQFRMQNLEVDKPFKIINRKIICEACTENIEENNSSDSWEQEVHQSLKTLDI